MSSSIPPTGPAVSSHNPEEVLKLSCPVCSGVLNLRRKHIGIEGACVQCKTPVAARDTEAGIALVRTDSAQQTPAVEEPAPAFAPPKAPAEVPSTKSSQPQSATVPEESKAPFSDKEEVAPVASKGTSTPPAEELSQSSSSIRAFQNSTVTTPPPSRAEDSSWGFPDREEESTATAVATAAKNPQLADAPAEMAEADPFDAGASEESPMFGGAPSSPPELPSTDPTHSAKNPPPLNAATAPTEDKAPLSDETGTDSQETTIDESPSSFGSSSISFENDCPLSDESSALFGGGGTSQPSPGADEEDDGAQMNAGWGTKVPTQNHASISPFATGSSDENTGFAETLFREKAAETAEASAASATAPPIEAKSPFLDPMNDDSDVGVGGALFSAPAVKKEPAEEVVLDGDGRPMKPMTEEEKDAFAREMMQVGGHHKRNPWVRRIVRFLMTIAFLAGGAYAAYVFMPEDKVAEWKNKTLDWLEPGSVLLEFLPFDVEGDPEGAEGEKRIKIKAIEGLNNLSTEMDAYLDASEDSLKESGAIIPERDKNEQMEMPKLPNIPKLPKLPGAGLPGAGEPGTDAPAPAPEQ